LQIRNSGYLALAVRDPGWYSSDGLSDSSAKR